MRLHCSYLNRSELLNLPLFEHPHSDQCLQAYRLAGGSSALPRHLPHDLRSLPLPGRSIGTAAAGAGACRTFASITLALSTGSKIAPEPAGASALCYSFPAPKPVRRSYSDRSHRKSSNLRLFLMLVSFAAIGVARTQCLDHFGAVHGPQNRHRTCGRLRPWLFFSRLQTDSPLVFRSKSP